MGKFKDKDTQRIYDVISESKEIQNLIRKIVSENNQCYHFEENNRSGEIDKLSYQLSQTKTQLQKTNESLEKYKGFYLNEKGKVESLTRECEQYENYITNYKSEIRRKDDEIEILKNKVVKLETENNSLTSELASEKEKIKQMKKQFESPIKYLGLYRELSSLVKRGLENVINSDNEVAFIISCTNEENLSSIWEYAREISNDTKSRDFEVLTAIFDYFFAVYNASLPEEKYIRDDIEVGEEFDGDYLDRCYGSSTSGNISEVVLRGYKLRNSGKIVHKSLVKV